MVSLRTVPRLISYDLYGYPQTIYFTNGNMTRYTYSGLGEKLCVEHFVASPNVTWTFGVMPDISQSHSMYAGQTDYLLGGSLIVQDGMTKRLLFDGGYFDASAVSPTTYGFTPYYYNKDHLGNNREVINASGTVRQVTNYYPFGAPYADPAAVMGSTIQQYKYNGKELDTTHCLNTYDYGARQHDPILGRWDRIDPLCEKYYDISPYVYCGGNPVNAIDVGGLYELENISLETQNATIAVFQEIRDKVMEDDYQAALDAGMPIILTSGISDFKDALEEVRNMGATFDVIALNSHGNSEQFKIGEDVVGTTTDLASLKKYFDGKTVFIGACNVGNNPTFVSLMSYDTQSTVVAAQHAIFPGYKYDGSDKLNNTRNIYEYVLEPQYVTYNKYTMSHRGSASQTISNVTIDKRSGINWDHKKDYF